MRACGVQVAESAGAESNTMTNSELGVEHRREAPTCSAAIALRACWVMWVASRGLADIAGYRTTSSLRPAGQLREAFGYEGL